MPFSTFISSSSSPTRTLVPDHDVEDAGEHDAVTESAGRRGRRGRGGPILLALVVGSCGGCGDLVDEVRARFGELGGPSGEESESPAAKSPATLILDLVPGIEVSIDDAVVGQTPLAPLTVPPGRHQVKLTHRCAANPATLSLDLASGETQSVAAADSGLPEPATLRLAISSGDLRTSTSDEAGWPVRLSASQGRPLAPRIWISEPGRGDLSGEVEHVLVNGQLALFGGCAQRVRVESGHPALGGYWEDIWFSPGQMLIRTIELAPGPDMVRLPGGDFVIGAPDDESRTAGEDGSNLRQAVRLRPFMLDRSPVTAAHLHECRRAGECKDTTRRWDRSLPPDDASGCANEPNGTWPARAGKADHPATCVSRHDAWMYCYWVGKRLATMDEYEYAARSGTSWRCPWGASAAARSCNRRESGAPDRVCSYAADNSIHGICDLAWMHELVADERGPVLGVYVHCDRCPIPTPLSTCRGPRTAAGHASWVPAECVIQAARLADTTFRCARDVQ